MTISPEIPVEPPAVKRERKRRLRGRNLAVFLILLGFVLLVYAVTITKIKMGYGP
jgi:hypothetical protein